MLHRRPSAGPLQGSVHDRLDDLTRAAAVTDPQAAAELAHREIPLLVQALRSVLAEHEPDARGRCPSCRGRLARLPFRRRNVLPCRAYLAAQLRLGTVDPAGPHRAGRRQRPAHLRSVG